MKSKLVSQGRLKVFWEFNTAGSMPYLPGTGGLLWATAMMAAGWDGGPERHAPGFPDDGSWVVRWEGLKKAQ